jgi:hypothetical protein
MSSGAGGGSGGGNGGGSSTKPSAPPGGGATSLGSGRDYSPPSSPIGGGGGGRDYSPPTVVAPVVSTPQETYDPGQAYQEAVEKIYSEPVVAPVVSTPPVAPPSILNPPTNDSENLVDPGFVRALDEQATRQADPVFGDPDPYIDTPIEERDTITSFLDNYAANVKSNPFELGLIGALKTMYQTGQAREMMRGTPGYEFLDDGSGNESTPRGGGGDRDTTTTTQPTTTTPTTPLPPSMVNQYFANMGDMGNALSSQLQTDYNNAKNSINSILGITPPSQQFGYSADPYGGLMASNLTTNPYNIDYLRRLGLI